MIAFMKRLKPYISDEKGIKYHKIIKNSSIHLANIVEDIIDMSRIENGKFQILKEHFNIKEAVNDVIDILEM